jgi:hypothetical protein
MGLEIIKHDDTGREADAIETAGLLAKELSYPLSIGIGKVAGVSSLETRLVTDAIPRAEIIATAELHPGDIRNLQADGHNVYPIGWGIAVE